MAVPLLGCNASSAPMLAGALGSRYGGAGSCSLERRGGGCHARTIAHDLPPPGDAWLRREQVGPLLGHDEIGEHGRGVEVRQRDVAARQIRTVRVGEVMERAEASLGARQ